MDASEQLEYDQGYADGFNNRPMENHSLESWYRAGYANGQCDRHSTDNGDEDHPPGQPIYR